MGRYRNVTILVAAIFLQVVGLAVQIKRRTEDESTRLIRVWAVGMVTRFEKGVVRLETSAGGIWHNYFYLRGVRQQNRELEQQLQQLELEQVRLRQDAEQAHRLQALLGFKEQFIDKTLAAQVIATSGSEQSRAVYLDKGSEDGVAQDMAVISADGIVGKVIQVFGHTSQVLLINDQASGVGTILEQSRLQGVLKGRPNGEVVLDKIMSDEDVKLGDRVLTSGGDEIFPKGLPVGNVSKVTRGAEFLQVTVKPASALNHLEEVLIIVRKADREPSVSTAGSPLRAADILAQRLPTVPDKPATAAMTAGAAKPLATGAGARPPSKPVTNTAAGIRASSGGVVRPLAQPQSGTGEASLDRNPSASSRVSPVAGTTGTRTGAGTGVKAPISATPTATKNVSASTGVSQPRSRSTSISTPAAKPGTTARQPGTVAPAVGASKPVADPAHPRTQSSGSGEAPQ